MLIIAHNGKFLTAESGGGLNGDPERGRVTIPPLVADRTQADLDRYGDAWQQFTMLANTDGTVSLKIGPWYVTAEREGGTYVSTDRDVNEAWQRFTIVHKQLDGDEFISFRCCDGQHYLKVGPDDRVDASGISGDYDTLFAGKINEATLTPRISVSGLGFVTSDNLPWRMAFTDGFRDYERFLAGADLRPLLAETVDVGGNGRRVFGAFDFGSPQTQRLYPSEHPEYYDRLPEFFALFAEYGLYVQFTVFADTKRSVPGTGAQATHFTTVAEKLRSIPNVLLERVNENDSHDNKVDANLNKPDGVCSSFGSNGAGADPPLPVWDYSDLHSERPSEIPKLLQSTTTVAFSIHGTGAAFTGTKVATVVSEPIGFADADVPGRRVASPEVAYLLGLGCQWGAGGTAHSDCGEDSVPLTPIQRACVEAFLRGVNAT